MANSLWNRLVHRAFSNAGRKTGGVKPSLEVLEDRSLLSFTPGGAFSLSGGGITSTLAVGDFNTDGKSDLVVSNQGALGQAAGLDVLLGNGNGTFQSPRFQNVGSLGTGPNSIDAADFNGDGKLDLVTISGKNVSVTKVQVFIGNGDGTFSSPRTIDNGRTFTTAVAIADINGDGRRDLVFTNFGTQWDLSVQLGNGDGSFQVPRFFAVGVGAASVTAADLNGDGRQDLVTANNGANSVSILLGNGNGTFLPVFDLHVGPNPVAVVVGHFNHDGKLDVATANFGDKGGKSVSVLLGTGTGFFQNSLTQDLPISPASLVTGDFNGDGKLDLGTYSGRFDLGYLVLTGKGDGTFQPPVVTQGYNFGTNPGSMAAGDLDGNGSLDLAGVDRPGRTVGILLNNDPAPASRFDLTGVAPTVAADQPLSVTVVARNVVGGTASPYRGTVRFSSSDPSATLPADYTFTAADSGVHVFSVTPHTAGNQSLTLTDLDTGIRGSISVTVTRPAATVTQVVSSADPSAFGQAVTFTATPFAPSSVTGTPTGSITFKDGQMVLATVSLDGQGRASYTTSALASGSHVITALYSGDANFAPSTSTALTQTVQDASAPSRFDITLTTGTAIVVVRDGAGRTATGYRGTIRFSSTDPSATLPTPYTFTAEDSGVHVFALTFRTAGRQFLTLRDDASLITETVAITVTGNPTTPQTPPALPSEPRIVDLIGPLKGKVRRRLSFTPLLGTDDRGGMSFIWTSTRRGKVVATGSETTFSFRPRERGIHLLTLFVTDRFGRTSNVMTKRVSVA